MHSTFGDAFSNTLHLIFIQRCSELQVVGTGTFVTGLLPLFILWPVLTEGSLCPLAGFVELGAATARVVVCDDFFVVRSVQSEKINQPVQCVELRLPYGNFQCPWFGFLQISPEYPASASNFLRSAFSTVAA